eukprot:GHUV01006263.1.p1 GENE.GHUV01006263.1~~GHUV01006263.1.p1  ORF type:complete len:293 (+),score=94.48 GHUV01006263.1:851-1729(+)
MHSGGRDDLAAASQPAEQQLSVDEPAGRGMSTLDSSNIDQEETDNNADEHSCSDYEDADEWSSSSDGGGEAGSGSADLPLMPAPSWVPDHTFKVLLIGDSGVGKTCLVMRFISDRFEDQLPSTVGVDFAIKRMVVHDLNVKVTIWDTAGQERFRALTSTFYRGAKGIIFVYDVTRRETLDSLSDSWMSELESYQPHPDVARMVVANKVDQHERREVTWQEGADFAKQHGCLFVETSAKQNIAVGVAFEELVLRILDTPSLLADDADDEHSGQPAVNLNKPADTGSYAVSCSC